MMYASKLKIKYEPQKIKEKKEIRLEEEKLTIDSITNHVSKDEYFFIFECEDGYLLEIWRTRRETKEEMEKRIAKAEKYNKNYEEFHKKI